MKDKELIKELIEYDMDYEVEIFVYDEDGDRIQIHEIIETNKKPHGLKEWIVAIEVEE